MSINDKVKFIWKTKCAWRDCPHWSKRKEMKLVGADDKDTVLPLKVGDSIKVKFGSRWYNAEVAENWEPKTTTRKTSKPPPAPSTDPVEIQDEANSPYTQFLLEQQTREESWRNERAKKQARIEVEIERASELKEQLENKTRECKELKRKVHALNEISVREREQSNAFPENVSKMMETVLSTLASFKDDTMAALTRIESRIDVLEAVVATPSYAFIANTDNNSALESPAKTPAVIIEQQRQDDGSISTIDLDGLARLRGDEMSSPNVSTPQSLQHGTGSNNSQMVSEDLIRTYVTPRKVKTIKDILLQQKDRHRCAVKLLPYFFSKEEMTTSNTDGTHGKTPLDSNKLNSIKVLIYSRFPVDSKDEEKKSWKMVKARINSKCRANKFAYGMKEQQDVRDM